LCTGCEGKDGGSGDGHGLVTGERTEEGERRKEEKTKKKKRLMEIPQVRYAIQIFMSLKAKQK
jgi:hypothetical protein